MNKALLAFIALFGLLAGCATQPRPSAPDAWRVDFRTTFAHERVVVFVNTTQVFSGRITTNDVTGLAKWIAIPGQQDLLHLRIEVPATGVVLEKTLDAKQGRYVGISKQFDGELSLEQQLTPYAYD